MAGRARRWWNILGKIFDSLMDFAEEKIPEETKLREDMSKMLEILNLKADAVSYSMALADEKYRALGSEVVNYQNLEEQAKRFLNNGEEVKAERCVILQLQSKKEIERLGKEYALLQQGAEREARDFKSYQNNVNEKFAQLERLTEDLRMIKMQEAIGQKVKFSMEEAERSFDERAKEIELKKRRLQNKALILADLNVEIDREIKQIIEGEEIQTAMNSLRKQIEEGHIEAELTALADPVSLAKKMLMAPRFADAHLSEQKKRGMEELKQLRETQKQEEDK